MEQEEILIDEIPNIRTRAGKPLIPTSIRFFHFLSLILYKVL